MNFDDISVYQLNTSIMKSLIDNIPLQSPAQQQCSPDLQRFLFSQNSLIKCKKHILNKKILHPKETGSQTFSKISQTILKTQYNDTSSSISFSVYPVQDPPLKSLKKHQSLIFLNLSYAYFTSPKTLSPIHSFQSLVSLSLHNCALFEVPAELCKLPPKLQNLDLSENYLSEIPSDVKWDKLKHINLSINCFSSWPSVIQSNCLHLTTLLFSFNDLGCTQFPAHPLPELKRLDLSYCNLISFPAFIYHSKNLEIINLNGNCQISDFYFKNLNNLHQLKQIFINLITYHDDYLHSFPYEVKSAQIC